MNTKTSFFNVEKQTTFPEIKKSETFPFHELGDKRSSYTKAFREADSKVFEEFLAKHNRSHQKVETLSKSPEEIFKDFGFNEKDFLLKSTEAYKEKLAASDTTLKENEIGNPELRNSELAAALKKYGSESIYTHDLLSRRTGGPNCYWAAMNLDPLDKEGRTFPDKPQPGCIAETFRASEQDVVLRTGTPEQIKNYLIKKVKEDCSVLGRQLHEVDKDYKPKNEERMIALVSHQGDDFSDYHFFAKGQSGFWIHKPGVTNPTNLDDNGEFILDPAKCKTRYENFLGYYVIRNL